MAEARRLPDGQAYHAQRVVCLTLVPSFGQSAYTLDPAVEARVVKLVRYLGPHCRVNKFQWLVATDEPCGGIAQDLDHEGVPNVLVFSVRIAMDWTFRCKPLCTADEWEFDGVAAFLQQLD